MHLWPNLSTIRASKGFNVKKALANRPKGLKDEEWVAIVAEHKLNKKIMLNTVPKESKKGQKSTERK
jgi:hypothetical protein